MTDENYDSQPPRERRRHVSFIEGFNDSWEPNRKPLPPVRVSSSAEPLTKYKHHVLFATLVAVMTIWLRLDYDLTSSSQVPAICYFPGWSCLERCPVQADALVQVLPGESNGPSGTILSFLRKDSKEQSPGEQQRHDVVSKFLHFGSHIQYITQLSSLQEGMPDSLTINKNAFLDTVLQLQLQQGFQMKFSHALSQGSLKQNKLINELPVLARQTTKLLEWTIKYGNTMGSDLTRLVSSNSKPAVLERQARITMAPLTEDILERSGEILERIDQLIKYCSDIEEAYNILAHPRLEDGLKREDFHKLQKRAYWWSQLKPFFKSEKQIETLGLATFYSDISKIHAILLAQKDSIEALNMVAMSFDAALRGKEPLVESGKRLKDELRVWVADLGRVLKNLENTRDKTAVSGI